MQSPEHTTEKDSLIPKLSKSQRRRKLQQDEDAAIRTLIGNVSKDAKKQATDMEAQHSILSVTQKEKVEIIKIFMEVFDRMSKDEIDGLANTITGGNINLHDFVNLLLDKLKSSDELNHMMSDALKAKLEDGTALQDLEPLLAQLNGVAKVVLQGRDKTAAEGFCLSMIKWIYAISAISCILPLLYYTPEGIYQIAGDMFNIDSPTQETNLVAIGWSIGLMAVASLAFFVVDGTKKSFESLISNYREVNGLLPLKKRPMAMLKKVVTEFAIVGGWSGLGAFFFLNTFISTAIESGNDKWGTNISSYLAMAPAGVALFFAAMNNGGRICRDLLGDIQGGIAPNRCDHMEDALTFLSDKQILDIYNDVTAMPRNALNDAQEKLNILQVLKLVKTLEENEPNSMRRKILMRQLLKSSYAPFAVLGQLYYYPAGKQFAEQVITFALGLFSLSNDFIPGVFHTILQNTLAIGLTALNSGVAQMAFNGVMNKAFKNTQEGRSWKQLAGMGFGFLLSLAPGVATTLMSYNVLRSGDAIDANPTLDLLIFYGFCSALHGGVDILFAVEGAGSLLDSACCGSQQSKKQDKTPKEMRDEMLDMVKNLREAHNDGTPEVRTMLAPFTDRKVKDAALLGAVGSFFCCGSDKKNQNNGKSEVTVTAEVEVKIERRFTQ